MMSCHKQLFIFHLLVNFFSVVFCEVKSASDVFTNHQNEVTSAYSHSFNETASIGSKNRNYFDFNCDCGPGMTSCSISWGAKICKCKVGYAQKYGYCEECDCGYNSYGCSYSNGVKVCKCEKDYNQHNGKCEDCQCGDNSLGCFFENDVKTCYCSNGYADRYGVCKECDCGTYGTQCSFEYGDKKCSCFTRYTQDPLTGQCERCDCGYSKRCELTGFNKECTCYDTYIYDGSGECEKCDCGPMSVSCSLTFDKYARCSCISGYVAERTTWEMDETCEKPKSSGWKIATFIVGVFFGATILVSLCVICFNRK